jgi:hypothetical protein
MLIFFPILALFLAALILLLLRLLRPSFRFPWIIALSGTLLAFMGVLFWQARYPASTSLLAWQPFTVFSYTPTWIVDGVAWPYALALTTLAFAIVLTSVVRNENSPMPWAGTLLLTALGLLAVSAGDPLTLILTWTAIDLAELITMLRSTEGEEQSRSVVVAFTIRLVGTGLLIWARALSSAEHTPLSFDRITSNAWIFLLLAAGLRLGVLPLHLPYRKENVVRRGFGTSLRLVSAAASLSVLARIPVGALESAWTPYLLALTALPAVYAGWMWLRASDEIIGRPFWVLGMASLAVASTLRASPLGSIGWGVSLVLSGGMIFLYSSRQRSIIWLPLLGLWGLLALPFTPSASAWVNGGKTTWLLILPFLVAQALLISGLVRHTLHPGETSFESQERWAGVLYPAGLFLLAGCSILLGVWGWQGARVLGNWWTGILVTLLAAGIFALSMKFLSRTPEAVSQWSRALRLQGVYAFLNSILRFIEAVARLVTSTLEGEGGIFWSILLLVLILSLITAGGGL